MCPFILNSDQYSWFFLASSDLVFGWYLDNATKIHTIHRVKVKTGRQTKSLYYNKLYGTEMMHWQSKGVVFVVSKYNGKHQCWLTSTRGILNAELWHILILNEYVFLLTFVLWLKLHLTGKKPWSQSSWNARQNWCHWTISSWRRCSGDSRWLSSWRPGRWVYMDRDYTPNYWQICA